MLVKCVKSCTMNLFISWSNLEGRLIPPVLKVNALISFEDQLIQRWEIVCVASCHLSVASSHT